MTRAPGPAPSRAEIDRLAADLPIAEVVDPVRHALLDPDPDLADANQAGPDRTGRRLQRAGRVVVVAPPGAGKTTIVPLVLLGETWCTGTVLVLEPRRLAVRNAARRLAMLLGEGPGERVGWRMRQDTKVSARTRIEVITEGVLTRRLQHDPDLAGVSAVVFDEFHERSLDADLGLALTCEVVDALRPDLRIVVMSATLDAEPVAALLDAPVVRSRGRTHPVDIVHVDPAGRHDQAAGRRDDPATTVPPVVRRALRDHDGDILVFLPGAAEIRRTQQALGDLGPGVAVRPLFGALSPSEQDAAIAPADGDTRKVVLSTSIAETSLTIEGVTVVVDAGWRRTPRLDAGTGMSRLVTLPVTRAEADQRAGRAGRVRPGTAYRLWSAATHAALRAYPEPEIEVADLTSLALELAAWGASEDELAWLTPPPAGHLAAARGLLVRLGALDGAGTITTHGRSMADLPLHPRLAHLVLRGVELGHGALACDLAAALHESGLSRRRRTDVADRVSSLTSPGDHDRGAVERARRDARRLRTSVGVRGRPGDAFAPAAGADPNTPAGDAIGLLVGLGFPDRVGRARGARGSFLLANGRGATVASTDPLAGADFIAVAELDGAGPNARIHAAAPLDETDVRTVAGDAVDTVTEVVWDPRRADVVARQVERFGAVTLVDRPLDDPPGDLLVAALVDGIRREGAGLLPWDDDSRRLQARLGFLHHLDPDRWPDVDDEALVAEVADRIGPHLVGIRRRRDLRRVDLAQVLLAGASWRDRGDVDRLAPERLEVPSGHRHRVDYDSDPPILAVKLQEMFGATETPTVADGRVPVVLHLLSPAGRPLQVTQDLASFWRGAYAQVRADMRGRYPKHPWPEDPTTATPTARTRRR